MYYTNKNPEDFDHFIEHLGLARSNCISDSAFVFLDLETYIFGAGSKTNFSNHNLNSRELNDKFNKLLAEFATFEKNNPNEKQYRVLLINLIDVKSSVDDELFRWSYYNHKFSASQGKDTSAMDQWHELEKTIDVNKIAQFKARRENNIAHYMHIIKNSLFLDEIIFGGICQQIKAETKFGLDIAEETYLAKLIKENKAEKTCSIVAHKLTDPVLNLTKKFFLDNKIQVKATIVSNSKKLSGERLQMLRNIFSFLKIKEASIEECDFAVLVNDLEDLGLIPIVDTDRPIVAIDLSKESTPNFSYLLLKDEGFDQVYGYAKKRKGENEAACFNRALWSGLIYFISRQRFKKQLMLNYMDDYFTALASSLGKNIEDFRKSIDLLSEKLEY